MTKTDIWENNNFTASILEECRMIPEYVRKNQKKNILHDKSEENYHPE
jgi:hypothetical protein